MTIFLIIVSVLAALAILVWIMVLFTNEVQNEQSNDAFTPVWMTFLFLSGPWFVLIITLKNLNFMDIPFWTIIPLTVVGLVIAYISGYKALQSFLHQKEEFLKAERLKIDSEYKKRFELIPNLVKVIKSFTDNENKTIERVLETRERTIQAYSDTNRKNFDQSVNVLLHSAYDYPALQNMPLYRSLTANLISTQENINYYTTQYNEAVSAFNANLKSFPTNLFYKRMNFKPAEYLDTDVTEEQKKSTELLNGL